MDGDFQSNYLAAEQAYGAGDFEAARRITHELLSQLEPVPEDGSERDAVLAWRAFVALLAGHIELYGFQDPAQAESFYKLVLASNPQDTLRELAEQGLERIRSDRESVTRSTQATDPYEDRRMESLPTKGSLALVADPFLNEASSAVDSVRPSTVATAMPWLNNDEQSDNGHDQTLSTEISGVAEPAPEAEPQPISEQEPEPETTSEITELNNEQSDDSHDQAISIEIDAVAEPELEAEPQPISERVPEPETESKRDSELVQMSATEAVIKAAKPNADPEISDTIRNRLAEGRIVVKLSEKALPPSEDNSDSGQATGQWSWLRKALRRS